VGLEAGSQLKSQGKLGGPSVGLYVPLLEFNQLCEEPSQDASLRCRNHQCSIVDFVVPLVLVINAFSHTGPGPEEMIPNVLLGLLVRFQWSRFLIAPHVMLPQCFTYRIVAWRVTGAAIHCSRSIFFACEALRQDRLWQEANLIYGSSERTRTA
jgi:hypothetical protein